MLATVVMPPAIAAREPDQKSSTQIGKSEPARSAPGAHRCMCASMPPGSDQQAAGVELLGARHRAAELGDPAAGDADVGGFGGRA